jgi:mannose-6-phosphate isomerase
LEGMGVELMANSDNVLRGGCTPKHVDVNELLKILTFRGGPIPIINPAPSDAVVQRYLTEAREFELSRIQVTDAVSLAANPGPRIVLVARGNVRLRQVSPSPSETFAEVELHQGQSAYLLPDSNLTLEGSGLVFVSGLGQWDSPRPIE